MVSLEKPDFSDLIALAEAPRLRPVVVEDRRHGQDEKGGMIRPESFVICCSTLAIQPPTHICERRRLQPEGQGGAGKLLESPPRTYPHRTRRPLESNEFAWILPMRRVVRAMAWPSAAKVMISPSWRTCPHAGATQRIVQHFVAECRRRVVEGVQAVDGSQFDEVHADDPAHLAGAPQDGERVQIL